MIDIVMMTSCDTNVNSESSVLFIYIIQIIIYESIKGESEVVYIRGQIRVRSTLIFTVQSSEHVFLC